MTTRFRWGIVGCGYAAKKFRVAIQSIPDQVIAAVASRLPADAIRFSNELLNCRPYDRYQDLIDSAAVDAVYVATPATQHFEPTTYAIQAGIPVLCEKPLSVRKSETQTMIDLAGQKKVFLMEAQWNRFTPLFEDVISRIRTGELGRVESVEASFGKALDSLADQRLYSPEMGGGALFDLGIYPVSFAHAVFAESPTNFRVIDCRFRGDVESHISVEIGYPNQRLARVSASIDRKLSNTANVIGTGGEVCIPEFWKAETARLFKSGRPPDTIRHPFSANGMEYQALHVKSYVDAQESESTVLPLNETAEVCDILDQIREQLEVRSS